MKKPVLSAISQSCSFDTNNTKIFKAQRRLIAIMGPEMPSFRFSTHKRVWSIPLAAIVYFIAQSLSGIGLMQ
jgi:hypothetical protein